MIYLFSFRLLVLNRYFNQRLRHHILILPLVRWHPGRIENTHAAKWWCGHALKRIVTTDALIVTRWILSLLRELLQLWDCIFIRVLMAYSVLGSQIGGSGRGHFQVWVIHGLQVVWGVSFVEWRMLSRDLLAWGMVQDLRDRTGVLDEWILFLRWLLDVYLVCIARSIFLIQLDLILLINFQHFLKHDHLLRLSQLTEWLLQWFIAQVLIRNCLRWILHGLLEECMAIRWVVSSTWTHHNNIKFSFIKMRLLMWIGLCNRCINNHFIVILLGKRKKVNNLVLFLRELELCRLDTRNSLLRISHWLVNGF